PLGRHVRNYWDDHQKLLYSSVGYPNPLGSPPTVFGPRDNLLNSIWRFAYDEAGNRTHAADPSGRVDHFVYDAGRRVTEIRSAIAHMGIQGNWTDEYGSDGWILCGFESDDSDREDLPVTGYVVSVTSDTSGPFAGPFISDNVPSDCYLIDPRVPRDRTTMERQTGFWKPASGTSFTFRVNLRNVEHPDPE